MVAAVTVSASQAYTLAGAESTTDIGVSQAYVLVAGVYPAASVSSSQLYALAATLAATDVEVSQSYVLVACKMATTDPQVRVWTFTLDGHDFYVVRLGTTETLVYDTHTEQWYNWASGTGSLWRAYQGTNWDGGNLWAAGYGSNVVVGDQANGAIYFLNPDGVYDDDYQDGELDPHPFTREVTAQYPLRGRAAVRNYSAALGGSIGNADDDEATDIELLISDDRGTTYVSCGEVTNPGGVYNRRIEWRSLGSIRNPGRLFKVRDYGAIKRLDSLDIDDGLEE